MSIHEKHKTHDPGQYKTHDDYFPFNVSTDYDSYSQLDQLILRISVSPPRTLYLGYTSTYFVWGQTRLMS